MFKPFSYIRTRRAAARAVLAIVLAVPATAIAAPPTGDDSVPPAKEDASAGAETVALISGIAVGLTVEPEAGPFHPVDGPVDYGEAEAGFGNERGRPHEGQDIFAPAGTPVISPLETTVIETGGGDDRGNWAALYDPAGDRTFVYFHMLEPAEVKAGQKLSPGDRVGLLGCTGSCYGEHLHFEIRDGRDPYGTPHDPLPELQRWERLPHD